MKRGLILDDVGDRDRAHITAGGWWMFRTMAAGEHGERVELERAESPRARDAWRAYEVVQQTMEIGGDAAILLLLALLEATPDDDGAVAVGTGPLEDLINDHGDELVDLVERAARQSPAFGQALGAVAVEQGTLQEETADRLARWLPSP